MKIKLLNPLADPVFKRVFGEEKDILISLINSFIELDEPVVEIEYLPQEILHELPEGKLSVVDVRCIDSKKRTFIFEIQIVRQLHFESRVLYYAAKAYSKQLVKSKKYQDLQPVYLMSILDHVIDDSSEKWLQRYSFIEETDLSKKVKGIHLIYLELEKCRKNSNFKMDNAQAKWITFLTNPEKIIAMSTQEKQDYPFLIKAVELLDESKYTPSQLVAYDKYVDGVMTWNSVMSESFDNGVDKGASQTVAILKELKSGKKSIEEIALNFSVELEFVNDLKKLLEH